MNQEPTITINGQTLTEGQSMTIRVALESFHMDLHQNGLGDGEHGKKMADAYSHQIAEIRRIIFAGRGNSEH